MKNLEIKEFKPSILRNATLLRNGNSFMKTYNLNNGLIFKMVKDREENNYVQSIEHDDFVECLYNKLLLSKYFNSSSLVLPKTIYMNKDRLVGYTVPFVNMKSFDEVIRNVYDFDFLIDAFDKLAILVKEHNKSGINFPDLGNATNILLNPRDLTIKFIDYDGFQIDDYDSFAVAKIMNALKNPVLCSKKYYDKRNNLYTNNFDKATLLTLFLYYTTNTIITDFNSDCFEKGKGRYVIKDNILDSYLKSVGLLDSPLDRDIRLMYDISNNKYLNTSIKRLKKEYKWDTHSFTFNKR